MLFRPTPHFSSMTGFFMFPGRWRYLRIPMILLGLGLAAYGAFWGLALVVATLPSYLETSPEETMARFRSRRAKRAKAKQPAQVVERRPAQTCVYCHDELAGEAAALGCQGCGSTYHPACFAELGRCAALGCGPSHPAKAAPLKEAR